MEILEEPDPVLFDHTFNFVQQFFMLLLACKVLILIDVSGLESRSGSMDDVFKAVTVF